jgi:hypothetical protein
VFQKENIEGNTCTKEEEEEEEEEGGGGGGEGSNG